MIKEKTISSSQDFMNKVAELVLEEQERLDYDDFPETIISESDELSNISEAAEGEDNETDTFQNESEFPQDGDGRPGPVVNAENTGINDKAAQPEQGGANATVDSAYQNSQKSATNAEESKDDIRSQKVSKRLESMIKEKYKYLIKVVFDAKNNTLTYTDPADESQTLVLNVDKSGLLSVHVNMSGYGFVTNPKTFIPYLARMLARITVDKGASHSKFLLASFGELGVALPTYKPTNSNNTNISQPNNNTTESAISPS